MDAQRTILPLITEYIRRYSVTIITGPRLVGKKAAVRLALSKQGSLYYSFDDPELRLQALQNPKEFLQSLSWQCHPLGDLPGAGTAITFTGVFGNSNG